MEIDKSPADSTTTLVPSDGNESTSVMASTVKSIANATQTTILVTSSASLSITAQKLVNGLPPLPVGREFVRQYYTMMGKSPKHLYRFYSANSTLTFGNNPILIGQDKIRKDIERRELHNCHAYIIKIDSQPTLGNGVVVQVIGELSNNNEPLRPFTQTFVLSPHIPKNFYVHNEIFRYQDELYPEINLEALKLPIAENQLTTTTKADQVAPEVSDSFAPSMVSQVAGKTKTSLIVHMDMETHGEAMVQNESLEPVVFVTRKNQLKITSSSVGIQATSITEEVQEVMKSPNAIEVVHSKPETIIESDLSIQPILTTHSSTDMEISCVLSSKKASLISSNPIEHDSSKPQAHRTDHSDALPKAENLHNISLDHNPESEKDNLDTKTPISAPSTPMTYANVFKSASGLLKQPANDDIPSVAKTDVKPVFIPSATFTPSTSSVALSSGDTSTRRVSIVDNKPHKKVRIDGGSNYAKSGKAGGNNIVSSVSFQQQRRLAQRRERYDDGLQLFLGNLPVSATVEALTPIFDRYGTILELRVLSKAVQPGMRKLPNYGFLTYDCPEAVQRCLDDGPFYFPENTRNGVRLNVRPKNSDENQTARNNKPPTNTDHSGDPSRNAGYCVDKNANRRYDKRGRVPNPQEPDLPRASGGKEEISNTARSVMPNNHEEQKSLLMEDWPQLCGPVSDGGGNGGCGNNGGIRRKKDYK